MISTKSRVLISDGYARWLYGRTVVTVTMTTVMMGITMDGDLR